MQSAQHGLDQQCGRLLVFDFVVAGQPVQQLTQLGLVQLIILSCPGLTAAQLAEQRGHRDGAVFVQHALQAGKELVVGCGLGDQKIMRLARQVKPHRGMASQQPGCAVKQSGGLGRQAPAPHGVQAKPPIGLAIVAPPIAAPVLVVPRVGIVGAVASV